MRLLGWSSSRVILVYLCVFPFVPQGSSDDPSQVYQMVEVPDVNLSAPTRAPTKNKMVKKVLGSLLVKSCVLLDPEGEYSVSR